MQLIRSGSKDFYKCCSFEILFIEESWKTVILNCNNTVFHNIAVFWSNKFSLGEQIWPTPDFWMVVKHFLFNLNVFL